MESSKKDYRRKVGNILKNYKLFYGKCWEAIISGLLRILRVCLYLSSPGRRHNVILHCGPFAQVVAHFHGSVPLLSADNEKSLPSVAARGKEMAPHFDITVWTNGCSWVSAGRRWKEMRLSQTVAKAAAGIMFKAQRR